LLTRQKYTLWEPQTQAFVAIGIFPPTLLGVEKTQAGVYLLQEIRYHE
jgi:hypothetical protein